MTTTPPVEEQCIGIRLGTNNACAGVWRNGRVEILANEEGNRTTPCFVAFTTGDDDNPFVGDKAKVQAPFHPALTVFGTVRFIGRSFLDVQQQQQEQEEIRRLPFSLVPALNGRPAVSIERPNTDLNGQSNSFVTKSIDEITSILLKKMKDIAEAHFLSEDGMLPSVVVKHAVIAVPAQYTDAQRQVLRDAGKRAGLNVLRTMLEPIAAAIAYGLDDEKEGEKMDGKTRQQDISEQEKDDERTMVLVFNFGGASCNVSVLAIEEGIFEVVASAVDDRLGGDNIDRRMIDYVKDKFFKDHGSSLSEDQVGSLEASCKRAKHMLSTCVEATVEIDVGDDIPYGTTFKRSTLEGLCSDHFQKCLDLCKRVLKNGRISSNQIDKVILAGGSSRMPKIRAMVSNDFVFKKGVQVCDSIDPMEVVTHGVTIQAARLSGKDRVARIPPLDVLGYAPLSYGVETAGGIMTRVIERQQCIPVKKTRSFSTNSDNQTNVTIKICDGERIFTKDNMLIATFDLDGIPPMPRGKAKIEVCLEVDASGILHASATECSSGVQKELRIVNEKFRLTEEIVGRMVSEAALHKDKDESRKQQIEEDLGLTSYSHPLLLAETG